MLVRSMKTQISLGIHPVWSSLLCWGLTSQSTIFQSCRDGAIASWVINQYFRGVKCLAQGHNTAAVGLEPRTSRSGVRHSTTEPPRSPQSDQRLCNALNGHLRTQCFFMQIAKTLISLGGCPGWSECSLGAQPFCWFCHEVAQLYCDNAKALRQHHNYFIKEEN